MRDDRSNYVDVAVWGAEVAGGLPWCRWCRAACPEHPVVLAEVEQLLLGSPEASESKGMASVGAL